MTWITRRGTRYLAAGTTVLTFILILLGVYTAASGAGLACSGQWPLCDGGLFPQTLPSFIEWFHRLVAMITGFAILGTTAASWLAYEDRRIRIASLVALIVTPIQALLGGATVLEYTPPIQTAHHGAAMLIFAGLLATTLWEFEIGDASSTDADADHPSADTTASTGVGRSSD